MNILISDFECKRCGRCCLKAGESLNITYDDFKRWEREGREDILLELIPVRFQCDKCSLQWSVINGNKCQDCGREGEPVFYWLDKRYPPTYGAQVLLGQPKCPFLKRVKKGQYSCLIHDTKPEACRDFPQLEKERVTVAEEQCQEWKCKGYLDWKKTVRGE